MTPSLLVAIRAIVLVVVELLNLQKKYCERRRLRYFIPGSLPATLLMNDRTLRNIDDFVAFMAANNGYSDEILSSARLCISNLSSGLKHNSMHCLTAGTHFPSITGFTLNEFSLLFAKLRSKLREAFPTEAQTPLSVPKTRPLGCPIV